MSILDTRAYRWAQAATDFFLLNLLWLVACLPVVTAPPATTAVFGVIRGWIRGKEAAENSSPASSKFYDPARDVPRSGTCPPT